MLFDSWNSIARVAAFGSAAYVFAILMLRISGSRTLSKMNAFDLVITIAFGSTLSAIFTDNSLSLATGLAALALLIVLQFIVAALAVRSASFSFLVTAQPVLLAWNGRLLDDAMRRQRVTVDDLHAALRQRGFASMDQARAVVLEADGSLSVVQASSSGADQSLRSLAVPPD